MQCTPMRAQLPLSSRHPSSFTLSLHPSRLPSPPFCVCVCHSLSLSLSLSLLPPQSPIFFSTLFFPPSYVGLPDSLFLHVFPVFLPAFSLPRQFSSSSSSSLSPLLLLQLLRLSASSPLSSLLAVFYASLFDQRDGFISLSLSLSLWRVDRSLRLCRNTGFSPYHLHSPTYVVRQREPPSCTVRGSAACGIRMHVSSSSRTFHDFRRRRRRLRLRWTEARATRFFDTHLLLRCEPRATLSSSKRGRRFGADNRPLLFFFFFYSRRTPSVKRLVESCARKKLPSYFETGIGDESSNGKPRANDLSWHFYLRVKSRQIHCLT